MADHCHDLVDPQGYAVGPGEGLCFWLKILWCDLLWLAISCGAIL